MITLAWAIVAGVACLLAWDGWRRWLNRSASLDRKALEELPAQAKRLTEAEDRVKKLEGDVRDLGNSAGFGGRR